MNRNRLSLGLDVSTQSLSAVVLNIDLRTKVFEHSLDYAADKRLNTFGIRRPDYILPPRSEGEADQPPLMFLAAIDAMFSDLKKSIPLEDVAVINTSGQQHGHVYLNRQAPAVFSALNNVISTSSKLDDLLQDSFAYEKAPIWMTSNTGRQAAFIRNAAGGKERLIRLSGSDAQLRFTGIVARRTAEQFPVVYSNTAIIQLISSLVPAVLTGNPSVHVDYGNACGMTLMNYKRKQWSDVLLQAVSDGLPGGKTALRHKLPDITAPDSIVGDIAAYFTSKYGFSRNCRIATGSGDNPQSKVPVAGDLLSLGSSFVYMVETDGKTLDMNGAACAMYDGIGRPFMFGCRTNGGLVWDRIRAMYGLDKEEHTPSEAALQATPLGQNMVLWQPRTESFPSSGSFDLVRTGHSVSGLGNDYSGIIESSLAAVYYHAKGFSRESNQPLHVMGGAVGSPGIMRRVAAIWKKPVVITEKGGAGLGAAVAGISALMKLTSEEFDVNQFSRAILPETGIIQPSPEDIGVYHNPGGYLDRFAAAEAELLAVNSL